MAKAVAGDTHGLVALGAQLEGTERDTERIGIDRTKLEARPIGADGLYADRASFDGVSKLVASRTEPFAWVSCRFNESLGHRFQPNNLPLTNAEGLLLFLQTQGFGR